MKRLTSLLLYINAFILLFASPADPIPRKVIQPNGDTIFISLQGDEDGAWYEDERGNIIS